MKNKILIDNLPAEYKKLFVADGMRDKIVICRSPWHDFKEKQSRGNLRSFYCDVWATPIGSSDAVFDHTVLHEIKDKYIREPNFEGEIVFEYGTGEYIKNPHFLPGFGNRRLKWWGNLIKGRPDQKHNYIIAVDPSYGLGSANSALIIYDRNNCEQVGAWTDANTKPETLADISVAAAYWCGGITPTYVIWDAGGGCGSMFTERLVFHRYPHIYTQRREDSKTRKQIKKWGWIGHSKAKDNLLGQLAVALSGSLIDNDEVVNSTDFIEYKSIIIHDKDLLDELFDYVFREKGSGTVVSKKTDLSTGALERHGDRVIAAGLCVLACKEQMKGNLEEAENPPIGSFQARFNKVNEKLEKQKQGFEVRRYLF